MCAALPSKAVVPLPLLSLALGGGTAEGEDASVRQRKEDLEKYLRKLLEVPRMKHNPDVLEFLGLLSN